MIPIQNHAYQACPLGCWVIVRTLPSPVSRYAPCTLEGCLVSCWVIVRTLPSPVSRLCSLYFGGAPTVHTLKGGVTEHFEELCLKRYSYGMHTDVHFHVMSVKDEPIFW
jgi:hypothetical protein